MSDAPDVESNPTRAHETATYLSTLDCIHCGLCVEHCPTYKVTGRESANPRGRVYLMRALLEKRIEATPDLKEDLDLCLVCRACETACPSGVRFGEVISEVRAGLRERGFLRRLLMDKVLIKPGTLGLVMGLTRFYQRTPLRHLSKILPQSLRQMETTLPEVPPRAARARLPERTMAVGERRGTVAFLEGCVMPELFGAINRDTVRLLTAAGYDVLVPKSQTCCGALHEHDGDLETARALARRNVAAFGDEPVDAIITNSAGCGAGLAGHRHLLEGGPHLSVPIVDISRFLTDHGERLRFRETSLRFTYDAPCHLIHAQQEPVGPLTLLRGIKGATHVPLRGSDLCCGAAGIYNLDHPETANAILEDKLDALFETGIDVLVTGNPGCMMQWKKGIASRGYPISVEHPVTVLAGALADSR